MLDPIRREVFLRDLTSAMRHAEAPDGLGELHCQAPQWEQDRANAALWFDSRFFEHFAIDDFPELPAAVNASVAVLVSSFRRSLQECATDKGNSRLLASTHLWSIIERLRPCAALLAPSIIGANTALRSGPSFRTLCAMLLIACGNLRDSLIYAPLVEQTQERERAFCHGFVGSGNSGLRLGGRA